MQQVPAVDNFRANLRAAMDAQRLSQRDVAREADMSHSYVNRVLQGRTEPGLPQCERLAKVVGLPLPAMLQSPKNFSDILLTAVAQLGTVSE